MPVDLDTVETHEDVQAAVAEVIADQKSEEVESKSDAMKLAEDGDREAAEKDDEPKTPEPEAEEAEVEEEPAEREWFDDDLKKQVTACGIDEEDLEEFTSREEVERAMRLFDKSALEAGQKTRGEVTEEPEGETPEGQFEIKLDKEEWSEELVGQLTEMRDHYDNRVKALESRFAEQDAELEAQKFDGFIDSLGHPDLFGKTGKETKTELQRREDVIVAAKAMHIGLEQMGRPVDLDEALVDRVVKGMHADELGKKALKARTRKVSKQSRRRLGGSATKAHGETPETAHEKAERYYKELEAG